MNKNVSKNISDDSSRRKTDKNPWDIIIFIP